MNKFSSKLYPIIYYTWYRITYVICKICIKKNKKTNTRKKTKKEQIKGKAKKIPPVLLNGNNVESQQFVNAA